jgi:hypothetical protein
MGAVFRAHDDVSGRPVAVKVLLGRLDPKRLIRFQREGVAAANLNHPGILRVHAAGEDGGRPYLVCELVERCRGLGEVLGELPLQRRVELVRDASRALGFAHARGVVHRDVKPDNLLVSGDGRLLVADFGLAAVQGEDRLTKTGALLGTPHYLAPETFSGSWLPSADVWALGVVLYQALTDALPFEGETLTELAATISAARPTPVRTLRPEVSRDLERVCARALNPDPGLRYPNGVAFAEDLDLVLSGSSPSVSGVGGSLRALTVRRVGMVALPLIAVLTVAVTLAWSQREPRPAPARSPVPTKRPAVLDVGPGADTAREALAALDDRVQRHWEGVEWLRRYPEAGGREDVRRWVKAAAEGGPLARLELGEGWARAHPLADGRVVASSITGDSGVRLWAPGEAAGSFVEAGAWTTGPRTWVVPWPGEPEDLLVVYPDGGLRRLGFADEAPESLMTPALPAGKVKACFLAGPAETPSFVVAAGDMVVFWEVARPTEPKEPEHDGREIYQAAGRVGVDLLIVSSRLAGGAVITVRELSTETVLGDFPVMHETKALDVSPEGRFVAAGTTVGSLLLYEVERGPSAEPRLFVDPSIGMLAKAAHNGSVDVLAFTGDGRHLISASHDSENGDELRVWTVPDGELVGHQSLNAFPVNLSFDLRPGYVWVGTATGEVQLWALPGELAPVWR